MTDVPNSPGNFSRFALAVIQQIICQSLLSFGQLMAMSDVLDFLQANIGRVFKVREISKEVNEDLFKRDTTWAASDLKRLCSKGLIEAINGCYWIPPVEVKEKEEPTQPENEKGGESKDGE